MRPDDLVGQLLGHYSILRPLGYGGTATVFLAEDINLKREVAIKVFLSDGSATKSFLLRFAREARVLGQLDHPNILPVYDYGERGNIAYLVMPYMAGGSLRDQLRKYGSIPIPKTVEYICQVLNALQYAHKRNLIHRDIKPGNMLFKADGTLMLSDFGLVKVMPAGAVSFSDEIFISQSDAALRGTPDYMAPEQIVGQVVPASDIYATGAVMYELLTGTRLFVADNPMNILMQHVYKQPVPLRTRNPLVSPALEAAVMRAIEKEVSKRYSSAGDFLQALLRATAEPEQERPALPGVDFISSAKTVPLPLSARLRPPFDKRRREQTEGADVATQTPSEPFPSFAISGHLEALKEGQEQTAVPEPEVARQRSRLHPLRILVLLLILLLFLLGLSTIAYGAGFFNPFLPQPFLPIPPVRDVDEFSVGLLLVVSLPLR